MNGNRTLNDINLHLCGLTKIIKKKIVFTTMSRILFHYKLSFFEIIFLRHATTRWHCVFLLQKPCSGTLSCRIIITFLFLKAGLSSNQPSDTGKDVKKSLICHRSADVKLCNSSDDPGEKGMCSVGSQSRSKEL